MSARIYIVLSFNLDSFINNVYFLLAVLPDFQSPHPRIGDLVYLELELENNLPNHQPFTSQRSPNKRTLIPIFAYVKNLIKEMVTGTTIVHKEICE